MTNELGYLETAARDCPDDIAGEAAGHRYTYGELHRLAKDLQSLLVGNSGQRIGVVVPNSLSWISVLSAIWHHDSAAVLFPASMPMASLTEATAREGVSTLITSSSRAVELCGSWPGKIVSVDGIVARIEKPQDADQPGGMPAKAGVVLFSSGTTGIPKAVQVPASAIGAGIGGVLSTTRQSPRQSSSGGTARKAHLIAFPLYHISGLFQLILAVAMRAPAVVLEKFTVTRFVEALGSPGRCSRRPARSGPERDGGAPGYPAGEFLLAIRHSPLAGIWSHRNRGRDRGLVERGRAHACGD